MECNPCRTTRRECEVSPCRLPVCSRRAALLGVLVVLLLTDVAVGLNWVLSSPENLTSPAYDVAKRLAPLPVAGLLMILAAAVAAGLVWRASRSWLAGYSVIVVGAVWAGWAVMFTLAPFGRPGASFLGAILAACMTVLHLFVGIALVRPTTPPVGTGGG